MGRQCLVVEGGKSVDETGRSPLLGFSNYLRRAGAESGSAMTRDRQRLSCEHILWGLRHGVNMTANIEPHLIVGNLDMCNAVSNLLSCRNEVYEFHSSIAERVRVIVRVRAFSLSVPELLAEKDLAKPA